MNKKLLLITSAAITSASIYSFSGIAVADTGSGSATAVVVQAISITDPIATEQLSFGDIVPLAVLGTVIIGTNNSANTGTITPTGSPSRAVFTVDGENAKTYAVTGLPATLVLNSGANNMTVSAFHYNGGGGGDDVPGVVTNGGGPLYIGATLTVGASQAGGTYTGTYTVNVDYN